MGGPDAEIMHEYLAVCETSFTSGDKLKAKNAIL
jgi:hypothetical protein